MLFIQANMNVLFHFNRPTGSKFFSDSSSNCYVFFSPFLSADHELNDDVVFRCFITISWFASFSESNTFVNFSQSVHVTIIHRAAYCPSPKWATGSIWHKYPDPPSITYVKRIPTFVVRVTSAPRTGAPYLVNTLTLSQLLFLVLSYLAEWNVNGCSLLSPCDMKTSSTPSPLTSV